MTLTEMFLGLARARTRAQRATQLHRAAGSARFDEDQRAELGRLLEETNRAETDGSLVLRPITDLTKDCPLLGAFQPGPDPVLPAELWREVEEWVAGWKRSVELSLAGIPTPSPLLLHGPTGTGKTMLAGAICRRLAGRPAGVVEAHSFVDSYMGNTGKNLAKAFETAGRTDSLLVLEEVDALAVVRGSGPAGDAQENVRITVALMRLLEQATGPVIATTNRIEALDAALQRRFELKLQVPPLAEELRRRVLAERLGGELPEHLRSLPLNEALPEVNRMKRREWLAQNPE